MMVVLLLIDCTILLICLNFLLAAPIFKGGLRNIYFQPIVDKIRIKLKRWKASLLSIVGRIQLVKLVIQSMQIHTISIYSWPIKILKEIEKWIKKL